MATWRSKDSVKWSLDTGFDWADCENSWEYGTVSDFLTVHTKMGEHSGYGTTHPASERAISYSKTEALALLETLLDWAYTYEGEKETLAILERIVKNKIG